MKYFELGTVDTEQKHNLLVQLEELGEAYYYDSEACREILIVDKKHIENILNEYLRIRPAEIHDDFVCEANRVFLVVIEATMYVISRRDVSRHLDALVAQLEIAQMATAEG